MADIQQWRKKIQPSKVRTPLEQPDDMGEVNVVSASSNKRPLKKKMSSYFDLGQSLRAAATLAESPPANLPAWPLDQLYPNPRPEDEMDSVLCTLMSDPYARLDNRFNGSLLRIFESYRRLKDEKVDVEQRLEESARATQSLLSKYNMAEKDWEDEKQDYKDEIKRLEVLLAKTSKRGLAEVTLARQQSKLRRRKLSVQDHKETVFEFLEKTKGYSGRVFENQRATMRPAPVTPYHKERKWSQTLAQKKSMTNIYADLPFGTPPEQDTRLSLTRASYFEQQALSRTRDRAVTTSTESDETSSSFACEGETMQLNHGHESTDNKDFADVERRARLVARRPNVNVSHVMTQFNLFEPRANLRHGGSEKTMNASQTMEPHPQHQADPVGIPLDQVNLKRNPVARKASNLFHRLRPQLTVDGTINMRGLQRRFSFEPGDDCAAQHTPRTAGIGKGGENQPLRKSVSVDVLRNEQMIHAGLAVSPVASSPTMSTALQGDGRPPSRIPTPVYSSGSLAKPRQEREDSSTSVLTAIQNGHDACRRSRSVSSSMYSSSSAKTEESSLPKTRHNGESIAATANRLLEHTRSLRGNVSSGVSGINPSSSAPRGPNLATRATCQSDALSDGSSKSGRDSGRGPWQRATTIGSTLRRGPD